MFSCNLCRLTPILFCHELIHNRKYFQRLLTSPEKELEIIQYPPLKTAYYCAMKSNPLAFFFFKKKSTIYSFRAFQWTFALFWSHKQLRHYICSLEISLWGCEGYFFAVSDKPGAVCKPHYANSIHTSSTSLAFTYQWAGPCVIKPFMLNALIRNKKAG